MVVFVVVVCGWFDVLCLVWHAMPGLGLDWVGVASPALLFECVCGCVRGCVCMLRVACGPRWNCLCVWLRGCVLVLLCAVCAHV